VSRVLALVLVAMVVLALLLATPHAGTQAQDQVDVKIRWVTYINPTDGGDFAYGVCVFGDYIAVMGKASGKPYVALLRKSDGVVVKEWIGSKDGGFYNCISVGGKLYAIGESGLYGVIYVFDENLNILARVRSESPSVYYLLAYDGKALYIGGEGWEDVNVNGVRIRGSVGLVEKRVPDESLSLVNSKKIYFSSWVGGWIYDIGVDPSTGRIWAVGYYVDSNGKDHSLIVILDSDLREFKVIDYRGGPLIGIAFDGKQYAYIAGSEGVAKFSVDGELVTINRDGRGRAKIVYYNNYLYTFGEKRIRGYWRHVLDIRDTDLNIVKSYVLSEGVDANSYFSIGRSALEENNIYVAGSDDAIGNERIVVYSLSIEGVTASTTTTTTTLATATTLQLYVNASTAFSYVLVPYSSDMWLVAIRGDGPMIGRIAEKYFDKVVEGPVVWNYTSGEWYVVGVRYLTTVEGYPQYKLYQFFSVARKGDLVVAVIKYINVGEEVTLTQWWSHIHKGTDALRILPVPPGYRVESNWEREHWDTMEAFLKETKLYIGSQYYGTLREQRLWRSLPPGDVKLVRGSSLVVVKPLNELSTTRQIQLVVSNYGLVTEGVGHVRLDFQHAEVTLGRGGEAQYVYIVTLGREPTQRDIDEAARILPKLLETQQSPQPPGPIEGLWGYYNGSVVLVWYPPRSGNVLEYRVYRGSWPNLIFIGSVQAGSRDYYVFVDRDIVPGEKYCYEVVSVNSYGESRPISNCVYTSRYIAVDFSDVNIVPGSSYRLTVKIDGSADYDKVYITSADGAVSKREFKKQKNNYYEVTYYSPVTIKLYSDALDISIKKEVKVNNSIIDKEVDSLLVSLYVKPPISIGFIENYTTSWNHWRDTYNFSNTGVTGIEVAEEGVCYGMAKTEILYFMHYILGYDSYPKFPSNYPCPEASTTRDLCVNTAEFSAGILNNVSFAIVLHQIYGQPIIDELRLALGFVDLGNEFDKLLNYISEGKPVILVLGPNDPHAVVAWRVSKGNDGYYYIFISDPNEPYYIKIARYDPQNKKFYYSAYYYWEKFVVIEAKPMSYSDLLTWWEKLVSNVIKIPLRIRIHDSYIFMISNINISLKLRDDSSKVAYFEVIGDSQSFRNSIPGVAGVSENDFISFAIPKNYITESKIYIDPVASTGILMFWFDNSSGVPAVNGYLFNISASGGFEIVPGLDGFEILAANGSLVFNLTIARVLENATFIFNAYNISLENSTRAVFAIDWSKLSEATPVEVRVYNATSGELIYTTTIHNQSTAKPAIQLSKQATIEAESSTWMRLATLIIAAAIAIVAVAIVAQMRKKRAPSS